MQKENEFLLVQRSKKAKFAPGGYTIIGGSLEQDENFRQAAIREVEEEVGVIINPNDLTFVHTFFRHGSLSNLTAHIFTCTTWQNEPYNKEPEKHEEIRWASLKTLPEKILPAHKGALESIAQNIYSSEQESTIPW